MNLCVREQQSLKEKKGEEKQETLLNKKKM